MLYFLGESTHTDLKVTGGAPAAWECWLESPQVGKELAHLRRVQLTPGSALQALKAEQLRLPPGRGPPPGHPPPCLVPKPIALAHLQPAWAPSLLMMRAPWGFQPVLPSRESSTANLRGKSTPIRAAVSKLSCC